MFFLCLNFNVKYSISANSGQHNFHDRFITQHIQSSYYPIPIENMTYKIHKLKKENFKEENPEIKDKIDQNVGDLYEHILELNLFDDVNDNTEERLSPIEYTFENSNDFKETNPLLFCFCPCGETNISIPGRLCYFTKFNQILKVSISSNDNYRRNLKHSFIKQHEYKSHIQHDNSNREEFLITTGFCFDRKDDMNFLTPYRFFGLFLNREKLELERVDRIRYHKNILNVRFHLFLPDADIPIWQEVNEYYQTLFFCEIQEIKKTKKEIFEMKKVLEKHIIPGTDVSSVIYFFKSMLGILYERSKNFSKEEVLKLIDNINAQQNDSNISKLIFEFIDETLENLSIKLKSSQILLEKNSTQLLLKDLNITLN